MPASVTEIARFLDEELKVREIPDEAHAVNGLQVEASDEVRAVVCAVDASERAIEEACRAGAQLLVVHHGLFWSGLKPLTGPLGRKVGRCYRQGLSVYSAHAPLDVHPVLGNNVGLMRALGLTPDGAFGRHQGIEVGLTARCDLSLAQLVGRAQAALGSVRAMGAHKEKIERVGVITGGAGSFVAAAAAAGLDALVTGEGPHYTAIDAEERGLSLLLGGHWRTETFGVRALGRLLEERYQVSARFLELDTGL